MSVKVILKAAVAKFTEKRLKILEWISPGDFSSRHETISKERVENSGTWFLRSDAYQNWLNGTTSNLLCYQGMRKFVDANIS
jgi:hypothetical protein